MISFRYTYVRNNPLRYTDPSGYMVWPWKKWKNVPMFVSDDSWLKQQREPWLSRADGDGNNADDGYRVREYREELRGPTGAISGIPGGESCIKPHFNFGPDDPPDWIKYAAYFIAIKYIKPNAVTISPTISVITGTGGKTSPIGYGYIFSSKESFSFTDASTVFEDGFAYGWDLSASAVYTEWFYFGDMQNFSKVTFNGKRTEFEVGVSGYIDVGIGYVIGKDKYGGILIGRSVSIGKGYCPWWISAQLNRGTTIVH